MTIVNSVVIEEVPAEQRDDFPKFIAGNIDAVNPLEGVTDCHWQFEFKGEWADGSHRFFIWQIPGSRDEEEQVKLRLAERARAFGLCRIWIYMVCQPCTVEMLEYIKMLNETKPWKEAV